MEKFVLKLVLSVFVLIPNSVFSQFAPKYFALKDVQVIDGLSPTVLDHQTIIIRGNRIERIGPLNQVNIPDSCVIFPLRGKFVIPGLIDTHVHLATEPSGTDSRARAEKDLQAMLLSGITSVRDMAGYARALASLSLDSLVGDIQAPDIYYSALLAGPAFFTDSRTHQTSKGAIPGQLPFMRAVTHATNLTLVVAEAKGTGASAIKLYAQLDSGLARKITTEAHRQGLLVWSHLDLTIANPLAVIEAGVNSISHAGMIARWPAGTVPEAWLKPDMSEHFWDAAFKTLAVDDYIKAMLRHKTILDATLLTYKNDLDDPSSTNEVTTNRSRAYWEMGKRFTKLALSRGVPVCTGTDTDDNKFVQREMKTLVKACGFTPMQVLISATRHGAMALGIEKSTGTVSAGKVANLVVLATNPADNIDNIDSVELVIKNGRMFNVHE